MDHTPSSLNTSTNVVGDVKTTPTMKYVTYTIGGLGLGGNTIVIIIIISAPAMRRTLANHYIINQSIVDATSALFLVHSVQFGMSCTAGFG